MDPLSYEQNLKIGEMCEFVLPTFGIHPWNAHLFVDRLEDLEGLLEKSPLVGEIGLDYHYVTDAGQHQSQRTLLDFFLDWARVEDKIVTLHTKGAEKGVLDLLVRHEIRRAVIHWYSGSLETLREYVARGCYFTVGVQVTSSDEIRRIASEIPDHLLLTETDNPGGSRWLTGQVGMPGLLVDVVRTLATLRGVSPDSIEKTVQTNFTTLIGDDPHIPEATRSLFYEDSSHKTPTGESS
jgi:TatD DNase family protein